MRNACAVGARLGLELEMPVVDARTGASAVVKTYFRALAQVKASRAITVQPAFLQGHCVSLLTPEAECGLDNGFNLLETALAPVESGLAGLAAQAHLELKDVLEALAQEGLTVLNASQHPACERSEGWYAKACVPRPIYKELRDYRGWAHHEGIDAKAQNGINISVPVHKAAAGVNIGVGLAAASIAIFANSPLESGLETGFKETRLTLWPRMFRGARFPGDFMLQQYPARPFRDLGDYFRWMFGPGTVSRSLPLAGGDGYKSARPVFLQDDPCLSDFLHAAHWPALCPDRDEPLLLRPDATHFIHSQIANFLDARFRYRVDSPPALDALLAAWKQDGGLEALLERSGVDCYIEGRAPGANFADQALLAEAGPQSARSVLIAPMCMQLGLLRRMDDAAQLIRDWGWARLGRLRVAAMRQGLENDDVHRLCREVLTLARSGLDADERQWLEYAEYAVAARRSGADRLLDSWRAASGDGAAGTRLKQIVHKHAALCPQDVGCAGALSPAPTAGGGAEGLKPHS